MNGEICRFAGVGLLVLATASIAAENTPVTPLSLYGGEWSNVDTETRGFPAIRVDVAGDKVRVGFIAGRELAEAVPYSDAVDRKVGDHTAAVVVNSALHVYVLKLDGPERLNVEVFSIFKDSRSSTYRVDRFVRSRVK